MGHVPLNGFNQIGDEIISSLKLYFNLRKGIFKPIFKGYQFIEDADHDHDGNKCDDSKNDKSY